MRLRCDLTKFPPPSMTAEQEAAFLRSLNDDLRRAARDLETPAYRRLREARKRRAA